MPTASPCSIACSPPLMSLSPTFPARARAPRKSRLRIVLPLNPRLIYASLSAYGEEGDEADRTGYDSTAYWARTGLMDMVRATLDTEPARSVPGMGDHPSATALYAAIVTALYRREKPAKAGRAVLPAPERLVGECLLRAEHGYAANRFRIAHRARKRPIRSPITIAAATVAGSSWRSLTSSGSCAAS